MNVGLKDDNKRWEKEGYKLNELNTSPPQAY